MFERALGFAAADVVVADPAVGTGTFLLGVLNRIVATVADEQGEGAVRGAIEAAAKRLIGFEIQFGPFAVAQLRLIAELQELMKKPPLPPLRLFITDTLGNPFIEEERLGQTYEPIAVSRRAANKVKKEERITVVIGNPPYKDKAKGKGGWIEEGTKGRRAYQCSFGCRPQNGGSARMLSTLKICTSISGDGQHGKSSVPVLKHQQGWSKKIRLELFASSARPDFSTGTAFKKCATICDDRAMKFG